MKNVLHQFGAGFIGALTVLCLGATYNQFSAGGALSGTWNQQSVNMASGAFITGTLPVGNGGTGASTLTGLTQGNGTGPFTTVTNSSTVGQTLRVTGAATYAWGALDLADADAVTGILPFGNGGTGLGAAADDTTLVSSGAAWAATAVPNCPDTTGNHLNYATASNSFSCGTSAPGGFTGFANPTGTVGLVAVNGVANTSPRSDSAPALSQAIVPSWSGTHTFTNTTAQQVFNNTNAGANADNTIVRVNGSGVFVVSSATDAAPTTQVTNVITATRTGAAWLDLGFGNSTDNPSFAFGGTGNISFGGLQLGPNGTVGAPTYSFTADPNTGVIRSGADAVGLVGGGNVVLEALFTGGNGFVRLTGASVTPTAPAAGGGGALPATPTGYLNVIINGTQQKIPYYPN